MNKKEIGNFAGKFKNQKGLWNVARLNEYLSLINFGIGDKIDYINSEVWGVINGPSKIMIDSLNGRKQIIALAKFLSNNFIPRNFNKPQNIVYEKILQLMSNKGAFLELFLVDHLKRKHANDLSLKIYKGPVELDGLAKTDFFVHSFFSSQENNIPHCLRLGVQLTTSQSPFGHLKENHMNERRNQIDNNIHIDNNFSSKYQSDLMVLMKVNSSISKGIQKNGTSPLELAFKLWHNQGFQEGGPGIHLTKPIQRDFSIVNITFKLIIDNFYNFIKNGNLDTSYTGKLQGTPERNVFIDYSAEEKCIIYKVSDKRYTFIYSMKFYITKKVLSKN